MRVQAAPYVAALMAYLQALLAVGGLQQQVLIGLAVHAELVPRLWFSYLRVRTLTLPFASAEEYCCAGAGSACCQADHDVLRACAVLVSTGNLVQLAELQLCPTQHTGMYLMSALRTHQTGRASRCRFMKLHFAVHASEEHRRTGGRRGEAVVHAGR